MHTRVHTHTQTPKLEHYTGYAQSDLLPCITTFARLISKLPVAKQQSVREKYCNSRYLRVAMEPGLTGEAVRELVS